MSAVQVIQILVTLTIAVLLQYYIKQRTDVRKAEKDIAIGQFKVASDILAGIRVTFMGCYTTGRVTGSDATKLKMDLRNLANVLDLLETVAAEIRLTKVCKFAELKKLYFAYKSAVTGGSWPSRPYDMESFLKAENLHRDFTKRIVVESLRIQAAT